MSITCKILDHHGSPISGRFVRLEDEYHHYGLWAKTDETGQVLRWSQDVPRNDAEGWWCLTFYPDRAAPNGTFQEPMIHFYHDKSENLHITLTLSEHGYSVGMSDKYETDNTHIQVQEPQMEPRRSKRRRTRSG